ncbi:YoaK family protein [Sphingomonas koreensis]
MTRLDRQRQCVAVALSALAGYVDALAFIVSGGYFVSFMSGNSTRLGVAVAGGEIVGIVSLLILAFVGGVIAATLAGRDMRPGRRRRVMLLVAGLLMAAAGSVGWVPVPVTLALAAAAMGAENGVFADGGDALGLTYMTGALVKIGQRLALAMTGGPALGWLPYALLWTGLIGGGIAGGLTHAALGLHALWPATAFALLLTLLVGEGEAASEPLEGQHPSPTRQPGL